MYKTKLTLMLLLYEFLPIFTIIALPILFVLFLMSYIFLAVPTLIKLSQVFSEIIGFTLLVFSVIALPGIFYGLYKLIKKLDYIAISEKCFTKKYHVEILEIKDCLLREPLRKLRINIQSLIEDVVAPAIFFLGVLSPISMFLFQIYLYLKTSNWTPFSIIDLLNCFDFSWTIYPTDWLGLWNIFNAVNPAYPLSIILIILSVIVSNFNILHDKIDDVRLN